MANLLVVTIVPAEEGLGGDCLETLLKDTYLTRANIFCVRPHMGEVVGSPTVNASLQADEGSFNAIFPISFLQVALLPLLEHLLGTVNLRRSPRFLCWRVVFLW